jgi:predicted amidohydrolase YtcJ
VYQAALEQVPNKNHLFRVEHAQVLAPHEVLKSMTTWPAYAGFQEQTMGSLSVGKYADFVVLDHDIMTVPPERILDTHVIETYVGGVEVYRR